MTPGMARLLSARHFIIKCSCGKVIAQCRCMGPKTEEVRQRPAREQTAHGG